MEKEVNNWKQIVAKLPWILLIPIGICMPNFCRNHMDAMEEYAQNTYPAIKDAISSVTTLVPVSVAECIVYALVIGIPLLILTRLIAAILKKITWKQFTNRIVSLLIATGIVWNLFYITWGFNYFREPLKSRMELDVRESSVQELQDLCLEIAEAASKVREQVPENEEGIFEVPNGGESLFELVPDAYANLSSEYPVFSGKVTRAKSVSWSEGLSWAGIAGVYVGLTAEPNVNVDQPDLLKLESACHESAHQLGIASEDEAEFAGILAAIYSDNMSIVYSGLMDALIHCTNALYKTDPEAFETVASVYSEGMVQDILDYNRYWKMYDGPVEEVVSNTNDAYLKHNTVESGVKSYGESVDMLLAFRRTKNFLDTIKNI